MLLITAFLCSIIGHWIYSHWMLMVTLSSRHVLYAPAILADWVKCSDTPKDSKRSLQASTVDYHFVHPESCLSLECVNRDLVELGTALLHQMKKLSCCNDIKGDSTVHLMPCYGSGDKVLVGSTSRIICLNFMYFF